MSIASSVTSRSSYKRYMTQSLREAFDAHIDRSPHEQLQLFEELALLREVAGQHIAAYAVAFELYTANPSIENHSKLVLAGEFVKENMHSVAKLCEACARVEAHCRDSITMSQLGYVVNQIVGCIYDTVGHNNPTSTVLESLIRDTVRVPSMGTDGTMLTPDQDAHLMDSSIPAGPSNLPASVVSTQDNPAEIPPEAGHTTQSAKDHVKAILDSVIVKNGCRGNGDGQQKPAQ